MRTVLTLLSMIIAGCSATTTQRLGLPPPKTVENLDVSRYLGTWYEIASFPQSFQKGCTAVTATYTRRQDDGQIEVLNKCHLEKIDGPLKEANGLARVVDPSNSKLEVSFFRPFWADYWVLELGPNYEYAVVGDPSRDYLWILNRTTQMDPNVYVGILERLKTEGYEIQKLKITAQPR